MHDEEAEQFAGSDDRAASPGRGALTSDPRSRGSLAEHAERLALRDENAQLRSALESRAVIEQAKGIVIAHYGVDPDGAFLFLARMSQEQNVKLRLIATVIVSDACGEPLPPGTEADAVATVRDRFARLLRRGPRTAHDVRQPQRV
jgi:hypothetical protein